MLPVPRTTAASELNSHTSTAPGERHVGIDQGRLERRRRSPPISVNSQRPPSSSRGHEQHAEADRDRDRMQHQRIGIVAPPGAERARDRRGDAAAHRAGRGHLHQHHDREHQRHAGQRIGAELADEEGLDQPDRGLRDHHHHVGRGQPQQRRHDRRFEQAPGARVERRHAAAAFATSTGRASRIGRLTSAAPAASAMSMYHTMS